MPRPKNRKKMTLVALGFVFVAMDCDSRTSGSPLPTPVPVPSDSTLAVDSATAPPLDVVPPLPSDTRTEDERNTIQVFRAAAASTVFVTEKQLMVDYWGTQTEVPGSGSGFIWDDAGHVVTNFHVVKDAHSLSVTLFNHKSYEATVVGVDPNKDVAVIHIDAPREVLRPIRLPDKGRRLEVGQKALAIGNPFGFDQTLTTGVVSAIGRAMRGINGVSIRDMVQTDAAINPGNSGGPLLDSSGRLMGMNTMIYSQSGNSAGIGFAVPVATIARVVPQIIKTGHSDQMGIGIQIDPEQQLERLAHVRGMVVLSVLQGSSAEKAGLRGVRQSSEGITLGDVIVAIDGKPIEDHDDLYSALDTHHVDETAIVTVARDGKLVKIPVTVEAVPQQ
ncbi:MAG TPA: trypsin-like peptidase domain-containing protein [Polyangiaceae bacterium]|jgi:S1-C subfamily serine protease|nr:trypsin-like peptidase domain-containing protein [Polyangiaceae bacterium]